MLNEKAQSADFNGERMDLSEADQELIGLVASGLTDSEIATQLQVPKHMVLDHIARLLAQLGARERLEIILYAFSDSMMYQRITAEIANERKTTTQLLERKAS